MAEPARVLEAPGGDPFSETRLPLATILLYSLPTLGAGYMFLLIGLYLMKFATDVLYMSPAVMGAIFGLSRIWDAIIDPFVGYVSDRTRHPAGRRRPWLFVSSVPIGLAFLMAFSPPASLEGTALTIWMGIAVFGFYTATTVFLIPHFSLGAELTDDYHDRSRIFGLRHVTWTVGSILALVGMALLIGAEKAGEDSSRQMAFALALVAALATTPLVIFAALRLRERPEFQRRGGARALRAYLDVWRNPHGRLLLVVTLIENLGAATIGILTLYVAQYIVGTPQLAPLFILTYMVPSFATVPLWVWLSRRFGKKNLWLFSMVLTALSFGGMFFLQEGSIVHICVLAFLAGSAGGCGGVVGPSVQSDVIDYDEFVTGERKEGTYFAAWQLVFKAAFGVTLMLTGFVLEFSGFVPNQPQTEAVKLAILSLYALYPLVCFGIGAAIFARFSLGEREHAEIRAALEARRTAARARSSQGSAIR